MNKKLQYSINKVMAHKQALLISLFMLVVAAFIIPAAYSGIVTGDFTEFYALLGVGSGLGLKANMALIGNIEQPSDIETAPNQIGFRLWLTAQYQIDSSVAFPEPDANRNLGTIPLKSGEYMHYFDGVKDSVKFVSTGEKGDVTSTFNKTLNIIIAYTDAALSFLEQYQGKGFIPIWQECESDRKLTVGSYCKPMYLVNFEVKEDGDGKYITLTFGNDHWKQPVNYTGTIVSQAPQVIAQDAINLTLVAGNNNYVLSDPSAADVDIVTASGFTASDIGRRITIKAPATNSFTNTIKNNAVFILRDDADFVANPGSSITLEIYDANTLIELDRIETA